MSNNPDEILQQMHASFAEQLPLRLDAIQQAVANMHQQPWDVHHVESLQHLLHSFIGASSTFGFTMAELSARYLDDAVAPLAKRIDYPSEMELAAIDHALSQLKFLASSSFDEKHREASPPQITFRHGLLPLIYIVDDDQIQADALCQLLSANAYRVRTFNTLDSFRKTCLEEPLPFAIIMNMIFPEGREAGAEAIAELKYQHLDGLPIIFISIRDDLTARLAAFRAGASCYLSKPVQHTQLLQILNRFELEIPNKPYQVLLVDDDPFQLELHAEILRNAGMVVRTETNPLNTLDVLREFQPDVLLLDVYLPECQGPELAAVIREQKSFTLLPIIFLSSETDIINQLMALEFGGDDFLTKPVIPMHLVMTVKMHARKMRRQMQMMETLNESLFDFSRAKELQLANCKMRDEIATREQAEQELRIIATAFETQDAIMITDQDAKILRVNKSFEEITGYSAEEAIGQNPKMFKSGRHNASFYKKMWATLATQGKWTGEIWDKRKNGMIYPKWINITAVRNSAGFTSHYVAVFRDISESKQAEEEIRNLAFYDQLTGLPNRRLLNDRLHAAFRASERSQLYGALLFIDLDNFKHLNDTQGHDTGDMLLAEIARRLICNIREVDTAARLGGDEFVVLIEDLCKDAREAATQAGVVAEKIRRSLNEPYQLNGSNYLSTASIGVALFHAHEQSIRDLFKYADAALYQAKNYGRNAVCFFDPKIQAVLETRAELESELRNALLGEQLQIYYQMQVDNAHRITGAEALLRWNHPKIGLVLPDQFIPLSEDSGLILPISLWVLQSVCAQLKKWEDAPLTRHLNLSVNISQRQLQQPDFTDQVRQIIKSSGINPARLKFEISEKLVLSNFEDVFDKITKLKSDGVRFAIDDFGIGYSSLTYLRRLPLEHVKIDKSFIASITQNSGDDIMVRAINNIAQNFGLQVIAEGVETEEQLIILKHNSCESFQGYLFGKPAKLAEFETQLMARN